jgi:signal transduction histidine kinase
MTGQVRGRIVHALGILALAAGAWTLAFYLTAPAFSALSHPVPELVIQLTNSLLGVALMVATMFVGNKLFGWSESGPFRPIIDALERLSRGEFRIRLEDARLQAGPVGELTQSVNHLATELDRLETMRQEFVSNVSHELQSPLTSIQGFARALRRDHLTAEEKRHYLDIIEAEGERLSKLSANLLELAALESESVRFRPQPFRLDRQIRSLILACEPQWRDKRLEVEAVLDECEISASEELLAHAWTNLLHNGIKFTPSGGSLRVLLQRQQERCAVSIADTGIGIAIADQTRIFERFYTADSARSHGSGLGLAIVRKIVEMHGGTITVTSQPGTGSTFHVHLPVHAVRLSHV